VKELTSEERKKIEGELQERHGDAIKVLSRQLYEKEPTAIGIALSYLDCGCVGLRGFDERGEITGDSKTIESNDSCNIDHAATTKEGYQIGVYNTIFWKDSQEEFDRKYGNEQRIIIANKLFPPQEEE
jgi:hypothetical protein